jgi:hypothetical protein
MMQSQNLPLLAVPIRMDKMMNMNFCILQCQWKANFIQALLTTQPAHMFMAQPQIVSCLKVQTPTQHSIRTQNNNFVVTSQLSAKLKDSSVLGCTSVVIPSADS